MKNSANPRAQPAANSRSRSPRRAAAVHRNVARSTTATLSACVPYDMLDWIASAGGGNARRIPPIQAARRPTVRSSRRNAQIAAAHEKTSVEARSANSDYPSTAKNGIAAIEATSDPPV